MDGLENLIRIIGLAVVAISILLAIGVATGRFDVVVILMGAAFGAVVAVTCGAFRR